MFAAYAGNSFAAAPTPRLGVQGPSHRAGEQQRTRRKAGGTRWLSPGRAFIVKEVNRLKIQTKSDKVEETEN